VRSYDQARQFGKVYVGALNTGPDEFASLFTPGADVVLAGAPADPDAVRPRAQPGKAAFRRVHLASRGFVVTVRVVADGAVDEQAHRIVLNDDGCIVLLDVRT
jgi:hypothetical protein